MVASIDLQILLRLRPYPMGSHRLLCSAIPFCIAQWQIVDSTCCAGHVGSWAMYITWLSDKSSAYIDQHKFLQCTMVGNDWMCASICSCMFVCDARVDVCFAAQQDWFADRRWPWLHIDNHSATLLPFYSLLCLIIDLTKWQHVDQSMQFYGTNIAGRWT